MASTVSNGNDRLRKGNKPLAITAPLNFRNYMTCYEPIEQDKTVIFTVYTRDIRGKSISVSMAEGEPSQDVYRPAVYTKINM